MGDTHRTDNATPGGSTPAEDVPLQVTREVSDDPSNNQRETPFGGGDGCWSPLPTLVLLDNEIGEDEVVPDPEGTETPGEISNFQIHWFPERPVIIPKYFPDSPREVWSFSSPPMEPLFMQVLTDDLGIWTRMNAHKSSSLNISENDGSDDVSVLVRVKNITVLTLQSPNEAVRGESSLPLGDSLVEIHEIVALITDYLTRKDLEALAITSTTLRKMCHP
jgi:hypothetical protein